METKNKIIVISSLVWIVMVRSFDPTISLFRSEKLYHSIVNSITVVFYIILPIFGLLIDNKFGSLNIAKICSFIGALCSLSHILALIVSITASQNVSYVVAPLLLLTRLYFEIAVFCFSTELLVKMLSNSDQLSSYVWWRTWCTNLGTMITEVSDCLLIDHKYYKIYASSIHLALLVILIMSIHLIKRWTIQYPIFTNPLRSIFDVLCFAFKHKYPLKHSACSNWEEDESSRINLGKSKYGGPFLEKDVESVKTFFGLIIFIVVTTMIFFPYQTLARFVTGKLLIKECLLYRTYFIDYAVVIVTVPVYQFIIKCYYFCQIKMSMLQRTGIGIALTVLGKLGYVILDLSVSVPIYINHNETICLLQSTQNVSYSYYYMIPSCINSFGVLLITVGSFEFVFAQAPHSMRGLLIRLWFSIGGIYEIAGWMMIKPFKAVSEYLVPSCELYILIMNFLFMLVSIILFILFSKRYKLSSNEELRDETQFNSCDQSAAWEF